VEDAARMIDLSPLDRHENVAISFSGGKDSLACLYLLRAHLHRMTAYYMETGDNMPETRAVVDEVEAMCPNFVRVQSDVRGWIAEYGTPTDLLPYSQHGLAVLSKETGAKLVTRYHCCFTNLMWPIFNRIKEDGNTLLIRGTKKCDVPHPPTNSGDVVEGIEIWHPVDDWSHVDVQAYLRDVGAPRNAIYDHMTNAPECARCTAWWGEGRAAYLRERHPELFADYMAGLRIVAHEIEGPIANLARELREAR
jgi:phosphoadenosine phosphosulfate reductase